MQQEQWRSMTDNVVMNDGFVKLYLGHTHSNQYGM
jgi:hypothetical protein